MKRVFLDIDRVLGDFDLHFENVFKVKFTHLKREDPKRINYLLSSSNDFFLNIPFIEESKSLLGMLESSGSKLFILTSIPFVTNSSSVIYCKKIWTDKYLGPSYEFRTGPRAFDKYKHCQGEEDLLIDTKPRNISDWTNAGGTGILHVNIHKTLAIASHFLKGI